MTHALLYTASVIRATSAAIEKSSQHNAARLKLIKLLASAARSSGADISISVEDFALFATEWNYS